MTEYISNAKQLIDFKTKKSFFGLSVIFVICHSKITGGKVKVVKASLATLSNNNPRFYKKNPPKKGDELLEEKRREFQLITLKKRFLSIASIRILESFISILLPI